MGDRHRYSSSAFSPPAARQTSVALLRNVATGDHRLVTSISTRKSTEVLRVNLRSGRLELENDQWAESSYENESEALDHLQGRGYEVVERGYALLGYAVAGASAGVLLATRAREKAVLPGGHTVYAVTDSQWALVPLQNEVADAAAAAALAGLPPPRAIAAATEFWRAVQQFTLNNAHYYCETADISRPFPSDRDPREPNPEFVWNSWLRQPLVELGLYDHCPALLQGAVECSMQTLPNSSRFSMCLISRRSRRHPGTRYIARGLNSMAGPGNEIECELLTWTHPEQRQFGGPGPGVESSSGSSGFGTGGFTSTTFSSMPSTAAGGSSGGGAGEHLRWARVVWRRGTVPIWWGVQLQSLAQGLQAEVYVREEHPYEGTASYFRNVQRQHTPRPCLPPPAPGRGSPGSPGSGSGSTQEQQQQVSQEPGGSSTAAGGGSEGWTLVEGSASAQAAEAGLPGAPSGAAQQVARPSEEDLSRQVAVTCINLLHANPKKASELMLSSHFQDAMRHVRRRLGGDAPIKVVNFDWHGNMGRLTEEKAVEGFWSLMEPFVKQTGFAHGWMEPESSGGVQFAPGQPPRQPAAGNGSPAGAADSAPATGWPPGWRMRWVGQQRGLLRFNCADSLDRTNAATCFAMLPVLQEQLRVLGFSLECAMQPATVALLRSRQRSSAGDVTALERQQQQLGPQQGPAVDALEAAASVLPEGWEVRQHEGRLLYIDHMNKTTQWTPPPSAATSAHSAGSRPGSRPGSGAPLSARMMQSASGMLARLQQRSAANPGASGGGGSASGSGSPSPGRATAMQSLERRSSPPRMHSEGGHYWRRNSSSGSLSSAGVPHAASAPDVALGLGRSATGGTEAPGSAGAEERVRWEDPRRPWAFFDYDINDVRERLFKDAVSDYVEMFRVHGDIHSFLYTGSPAMHSHVLSLVVQGGKGYGATSGVGKLQNLRVAVQRRWNNTVSDTSRQQAMELFLGLRIHDAPDQKAYFPGLQVAYRDATQGLLSGVEPFESIPLPPTHSRHASNADFGPLGAGGGAALAGAGAGPPLLVAHEGAEEEEGRGGLEPEAWGAGVEARLGVDGERFEEDHAHAVPGVPAVEHDGVLGVRQSLLDLEPLSDPDPAVEQRRQQAAAHPRFAEHQQHGRQQVQGAPHAQHEPSRLPAAHKQSSSVESVPGGACAPASATPDAAFAAFDPLGAVQVQPGGAAVAGGTPDGSEELLSFDDAAFAAPAAPAASAVRSTRSQLEDLLL